MDPAPSLCRPDIPRRLGPFTARALMAVLAIATLAVPGRVQRMPSTDDMVRTPEGIRPRSLVHRLEVGDAVRQLDEATFARIDATTGEVIERSTATLPDFAQRSLASGWITYTYWQNGTGSPLEYFTTRWVVPPTPASNDGQTVFLFNGWQNRGRHRGILQPVLQWGESAAGGGPYWAIASWYVTVDGQAFHTPLQRVRSGEILVGTLSRMAQPDGSVAYSCEFEGREQTLLRIEGIAELTETDEALEAYGARRCSDYPEATGVELTDILMVTDGHPALRWNVMDRVTDCGQHADVVSHSSTAGRVDLWLTRRP